MKKLTLKQAAEDCHGTLAPEQAEAVVTGVQIDSRRVKPGDLLSLSRARRSMDMILSTWRPDLVRALRS